MVMSWIWTAMVAASVICAGVSGQGSALPGAVVSGAQAGVNLAISLAGSLCLWSGVGSLMERAGVTGMLARGIHPVLVRVFPSTREDSALAGDLSGNICANILGLGNAATPMGIRAARRLKHGDSATDELCRLIVLNTASIQLIPTNVAAIRAGLGSANPFDILPAVWFTSLFSAAFGVAAAWAMGRMWTR